jgi:predicted acylesterase/phospholipase RssA
VLDRLLEEPWLRIDGMSGTSAGTMNAAVLTDGHATGGAGARAALESFWRSVSRAALLSPLRRTPLGCCSPAGRSTISRPARLPLVRRRFMLFTGFTIRSRRARNPLDTGFSLVH